MTGIPTTPADHSLADVMPSIAASLGVNLRNPLALPPTRDTVLVLVDGLGAELIRQHAEVAPTLSAMTTRMISAGFPATTATSLTSLAVGAPCSRHGIVGYSFALPDEGAETPTVFNSLRWTTGSAEGPSALDRFPPREVQALPSLLELLTEEGVDVTYVMREDFRASGLTRAAFRAEGEYRPAISLQEIREAILAVVAAPSKSRRFVYSYFGDLDLIGHIHGPGSPEWVQSLREVDAFVADLATDLPPGCGLLVTADHGMVAAETVIDIDATPSLLTDVEVLAGEARVRHVHARAGAETAVLAAWREELAGHARVLSREQALDEQLFGPGRDHADRLGHVIAVATGGVILARTHHEKMESGLLGHHGANTAAEQHIPLILR
ncbi:MULTISPECIES: alkaline phosphatase family protein [unclassified Dietzia]|uniref:alkaline phosphatase family protein n=1 Tax=unclassified Dietzia TaxID=2617939 RepID=UPI0015FE6DED|nr:MULTISPECIES: nucleotide pyrophosphatase/phosphodiesterase family protein [unclassified Dietzia]MBB1025921.1 alkaline phosphatase family protein [Dietzia sp. DQ12-76]MBB1027268.1 alkaline phosphatase family protein [Dietzia sp. DQ11-38-2]